MLYEKLYDGTYSAAGYFRKKYMQTALFNESLAIQRTADVKHISSREYRNEVLPYWKRFGRRPPKFWFELYGSREHIIDPAFVPADIYFTELIPYLNNLDLYRSAADKCYQDHWFPDVKRAGTVCRRIGGLYYDEAMHQIPEETALRLCLAHEGGLVIKPSIYGSNSLNIHMIDPSGCDEKDILDIFNAVGANLIAQDKIRQHPELASLNSGTVNTIRVNSLLTEKGVCIPSSSIRVGAPGENRIAVGSGGFFAEILDDNTLSKKVIADTVECKDSGRGREEKLKHTVKWMDDFAGGRYSAGFTVPAMDKIRRQVEMMHPRLAHFKWIGWDWAVDEEGEPVLIEFNASPGLMVSQMISCRPVFGEMTEWILEDYFINRTWEKNQRQGLIYR